MSTCIPTDTTRRKRLANRRLSQTFDIEFRGFCYVASVSPLADGRSAEIFHSNHTNNSGADVGAGEAAIEHLQGRIYGTFCALPDIIVGAAR